MERNSGDMLADGIESESGTKILIDGAKFRGYVGRWHRVYIGNKILIDGAKFRGYVGRWHRV